MDLPQTMIDHIQRYCVHDGRGIRTTVFLKGCQLRCPWCANPETLSGKQQIGHFAHKCTKCGTCDSVCPHNAIHRGFVDTESCTLCGDCVYYCLQEALQIYGREYTPEELLDILLKDRAFYERSGGGVTFSGGEATLQQDYLFRVLSLLKEQGIHTALESNGLFNDTCRNMLLSGGPRGIALVDQFLIDLKHSDDERHRCVLGASNRPVLNNLEHLKDTDLTIRIPVIPGFNDDEENLKQTAHIAARLQVPLELLKFHNLGAGKYQALHMEYKYAAVPSMSEETLEEKRQICRDAGARVLI